MNPFFLPSEPRINIKIWEMLSATVWTSLLWSYNNSPGLLLSLPLLYFSFDTSFVNCNFKWFFLRNFHYPSFPHILSHKRLIPWHSLEMSWLCLLISVQGPWLGHLYIHLKKCVRFLLWLELWKGKTDKIKIIPLMRLMKNDTIRRLWWSASPRKQCFVDNVLHIWSLGPAKILPMGRVFGKWK